MIPDPSLYEDGPTDDRELNAAIAAAAEAARVFCNVVDEPALCSFIMPTIIDRDPVTIAISSAGTSPVLARWLRRLIENTLPPRLGELAALAGRWRDRVASALPSLDERRRFWESTLEGEVANHVFARRDEEAGAALEQALTDWREGHPSATRGEAWLVGAGPGDPGLLTLRGRYLLANADVVLYDRLVNPAILSYARRDATLTAVGKQVGRASIQQAEINRLLVEHVSAGRRVCRLKGGDPMVFGRIAEELDALLAAGLPFQIVPGVSSAEGCSAYAGIPLTLRDESQAILIATGHTREHVESDLSGFQARQTLALYMSVGRVGGIAEKLLALGHAATLPAAIVERGTTDAQRVVLTTLGQLTDSVERAGIESPSLLLIGETVRHARRYAWFGSAPIDHAGGDAARNPAE